MPVDHTKYAFALARAVDLLRKSAEAGEPQKAALRALVSLAAERSATIRFYDNVLTIDGDVVAITDPRLAPFAQRLAGQSVAEIVIARGAEPGELLALASGLAQEAGHGRIKERLRDAASTRVMVVVATPVDPAHRTPSVSGAFAKVKMDQAVMAEWNKFLDHGAKSEADRTKDLGVPEQPPGETTISLGMSGSRPSVTEQPAASAPPPPPPPAPRAALPEPTLSQPATLQASSPLGIALARLLGDPYGHETLQKLTALARYIQDAYTQDRVAEAIDACNALIQLESQAPEQQRNTYGVILKRILGRAALTQVAPYLLEPRRRDRAVIVLRRGGEDSVGLLVGLLAGAQSIGERTTYLDVLRGIQTGVDRVLALLSRSEWQVVRNTAEVAGEARLEEAVPYLARLSEHADDRVRRTAIVALAKIGNAATVEPLRNILREAAPELRALVAGAVGGAQARPLTGPLASLADEEDNPDVLRAYYKAIGRIGTPEAKQVLERVAAQKALFSRRGKVAREAAEDVLKTFGA